MRSSPKIELVIARKKANRPTASTDDRLPAGFEILPFNDSSPQTDPASLLQKLSPFLSANASYIQNLTLRPTSPHIEITTRMNPMLTASPSPLFTTLQEIFQSA